MGREHHLATLATQLRRRLVERRRVEGAWGEGEAGDLREAVRALVDEEAALLGLEDLARVAARIVRDSIGLGPLEVEVGGNVVRLEMYEGHEFVPDLERAVVGGPRVVQGILVMTPEAAARAGDAC